jgi:hypothetical protein
LERRQGSRSIERQSASDTELPRRRTIANAVTDGGRRMSTLFVSEVASQAKAILSRSRIFDLRLLHVDQERDCLILRGSVDSFYHKQLAQELLKTSIDGVEVINEIDVDYYRRPIDDESDWQ